MPVCLLCWAAGLVIPPEALTPTTATGEKPGISTFWAIDFGGFVCIFTFSTNHSMNSTGCCSFWLSHGAELNFSVLVTTAAFHCNSSAQLTEWGVRGAKYCFLLVLHCALRLCTSLKNQKPRAELASCYKSLLSSSGNPKCHLFT